MTCAASSVSGAAPPSKTFTPFDEIAGQKDLSDHIFEQGVNPSGWSFTSEPYLWALGVSGDVKLPRTPIVSIDYSAKDVLKHLDWGVMGKAEIRNGRWGILADGLFAQLSAQGSNPGPLYDNISLEFQQGMVSLALAFRVIDDRRGFLDVYAGARYNYLSFQLDMAVSASGIRQVSEKASERVVDGLIQQAQSYAGRYPASSANEVQNAVQRAITSKNFKRLADLPRSVTSNLGSGEALKLARMIRNHSTEYRQLLSAIAQATTAEANGQLTSALQRRVEKAKKKFAKALARELEKALPSHADGEQWWVDPMIGLRGQVNIAHWLFVALQGDVGGFGIGSDIAWNAQGSFGVNITRHLFAEVGWRYFYMDYANNGMLYDAAEHGFFSGIGIKF